MWTSASLPNDYLCAARQPILSRPQHGCCRSTKLRDLRASLRVSQSCFEVCRGFALGHSWSRRGVLPWATRLEKSSQLFSCWWCVSPPYVLCAVKFGPHFRERSHRLQRDC